MPELRERREFLHRVADAVDLQPIEVGEVIDELWGHLEDAAAGWREAGLDPVDAERRAIRGLGDPEMLGRELGRARHQTRQLLAAVGGGIFHAFAFGIWAYLTLWLVLGGLTLVGGMLAWGVLSAAGGSASGWFTGPIASLGTVAVTVLWFAWVGWTLPARVARSAQRSVRGVQLAVGIAGFVLGTLALWAWVEVDMDPVLAVGLPLAPVAFLLASQRPNHRASLLPDTTRRMRAGIALALVVGTALVGLLTVNASQVHAWQADTSPLGADISTEPLLVGADSSTAMSYTDMQGSAATVDSSVTLGDPAQAAAFAARFPTVRLEIWPATITDGVMTFGPRPLAESTTPVLPGMTDVSTSLLVPHYRERIDIVSVVVAVAADGKRVLLAGPGGSMQTPPWHGTLFDWWFAGR